MSPLDQRLEALAAYDIIDSPAEQAFDDLTRLTSFICGTPIALVTLLDARRQWFKSARGLDATETPIKQASCAQAIEQEQVFIVDGASQDERFARNELVTGEPHIRFYAGAPLVTPSGVPLGTICAIDRVPRKLSEEQLMAMQALARQVIWALESRKTLRELKQTLAEKKAVESEVQALQNLLPMCAWCRRVRDDESFWSNVEDYLSNHREMKFSNGVCPECDDKVRLEMGMRPKVRLR